MVFTENIRVQNNPRLTNRGYPNIEEIIEARGKEVGPTIVPKEFNKIGLVWNFSKEVLETNVKLVLLPDNVPTKLPEGRVHVDVFACRLCCRHEIIEVITIEEPPKPGEGNVGLKLSVGGGNKVCCQLFPTPKLKVRFIPAGTTIGWDDVPRRPQGKLRRRRSSSVASLSREPLASDGFPFRDNKRAPSPQWGAIQPHINKRQFRHRGVHTNDKFALLDPSVLAPVKAEWVISNHAQTHYNKYIVEEPPRTQKLGDASTTGVKLQVLAPVGFLANATFGAWGIAPIKVVIEEYKDKTKYGYPPSCIHDLNKFSPQDIHTWWVAAQYPHGKISKKKIRDLILWKLPIAKLFAVGWPTKIWKNKLLDAYKNSCIRDSLVHNKEYCPTLFDISGHHSFYAFHIKHRRWIEFPNFTNIPINITGMLGGDGGLLLLYGNEKPKLVVQNGKQMLQVARWKKLEWNHDTHIYPAQNILIVYNPITRAYRFLPPFQIILKHLVARMMVSDSADAYTIYLMGWHFVNPPELRVVIYKSTNKQWTQHLKPFNLAHDLIMTYGRALPLIKYGIDGKLVLYNVGEHVPDPEKPLEVKPIIISYNLNTLAWGTHLWVLEQSRPPSVPADPPLTHADPPTLLECNNQLFGVARCFRGTKACIQIHKLISQKANVDQPTQGPQPEDSASFVPYGPPMPTKYFEMNFPRTIHPYDVPLELNCVSGLATFTLLLLMLSWFYFLM